MSKPYTNEKGQVVVKLPVAGVEVAFRSPKGKDLKAIELASKADDATNTGIMMMLMESLCVKFSDRSGITLEEVEDLDAEDVAVMGAALSSFRAFHNLGAK